MNRYFGVCLEFSKQQVAATIEKCVAEKRTGAVFVVDATVLSYTVSNHSFRELINNASANICDGSSIALLAGRIHKQNFQQYTGSDIFKDFLPKGYRQCFLGGSSEGLDALREKMVERGVDISNCLFESLPFCQVEQFDYDGIAARVNEFGAELIWVSLGAPKQEQFITYLRPHLKQGVLFAVGAAFNFYSGTVKRAPSWMRRLHLEFFHRILSEPKKQSKRCWGIMKMYPHIVWKEYKGAR